MAPPLIMTRVAHLRGSHDVRLAFDSSRSKQHLPMRLPGRYGEGAGNQHHLGTHRTRLVGYMVSLLMTWIPTTYWIRLKHVRNRQYRSVEIGGLLANLYKDKIICPNHFRAVNHSDRSMRKSRDSSGDRVSTTGGRKRAQSAAPGGTTRGCGGGGKPVG